jgi:S1-C subfamily serine protease
VSGQPVNLTVARKGNTTRVTVRPSDPPANLGLRILEDVAGIRASGRGRVVIDSVARGSRAERIGITAGDTIVGVRGTEVNSLQQLNQEIAKAAEQSAFILDVLHGGTIYELTFPMAM